MKEVYVSDKKYSNYYFDLNKLRRRIAKELPIKENSRVLDVGTGDAIFAIELAKLNKTIYITGIDISERDIESSKKRVAKQGLESQIEIKRIDATKMSFKDESFDYVVNFVGLEDIHMTRGRKGVLKTFKEAYRVLKPKGYFYFVIMPPEEIETEAQRLEVALFAYICNAIWLSKKEYVKFLEETGFKLIRSKVFYTGKKLTASQAKEEIKFACKNVPKIYGIKTPNFDEIWNKFGKDIEKHGLGLCSKVRLLIAQKAV